jgi:MoaE-MoaD fusion protein
MLFIAERPSSKSYSMRVRVLFFGITHDLTGFDQEHLELPEGERLGSLWRRYESRFPSLKGMGESLLAAVNQEVAQDSCLLREGDEIAFLPPVSGGAPVSDNSGDIYEITRDVIRTATLAQKLKMPANGAVVVFEGIVRNHSQGRRTLYLEYEAYEAMAVKKMREIGQEAKGKFAIDRVGMIHRLGRLEIGETSVVIVVTAAHRRSAFEACEYAIDQVKGIVPVWKKEYFEDGAVWSEGEARAPVLAER